MNEKESRYLCIGCVAFCVVAIPMMLAISLPQLTQTVAYSDEEEQLPKVRRTVPAPPSANPTSVFRHNGEVPERSGIQFAPVPPIGDSFPANQPEVNEIDVQIIDQRQTQGFELEFQISNKSPVLLNLVSVTLEFFDADRKYLGSRETSCFYILPGQSKTVTAFSSDSFASNIRDYRVKLDKVVANEASSAGTFKLNVNYQLPCS